VLEALEHYYSHDNANVHRGAHSLSARATEAFEAARGTTARFIGSADPDEIVFTRNATEAINLVAFTWALDRLRPGDEILTTAMEHHSNLVPWQLLAARTGAVLRHAGVTADGELDLDDLRSQLGPRTRLVTLVHVSNTLGCLNPVAEVAALAHGVGARVLVDACQSLPHQRVNVTKFEAGTPAIGEAIGMGAALDYLSGIGLDRIHAWEQTLTGRLWEGLARIDGVRLLGPTPGRQPDRGALAAFAVEGVHAHDLAALLDVEGICIRSGHHCTQPLHRQLGLTASARASLAFTTTPSEIDRFLERLDDAVDLLRAHA